MIIGAHLFILETEVVFDSPANVLIAFIVTSLSLQTLIVIDLQLPINSWSHRIEGVDTPSSATESLAAIVSCNLSMFGLTVSCEMPKTFPSNLPRTKSVRHFLITLNYYFQVHCGHKSK